MTATTYPFRYRPLTGAPPVSPFVLSPDDQSQTDSAFVPNSSAQQQQDFQQPSTLPPAPQPIPAPPKLSNADAGASAINLPPLNPATSGNGNDSGASKVIASNQPKMPPPGSAAPASVAPPPQPTGTLDAGLGTDAAAMPDTPIPATPPVTPAAAPQTPAGNLSALKAPAAPTNNWAQRLALGLLAVTRLAPVAQEIVHPVYAGQRAAYNRRAPIWNSNRRKSSRKTKTRPNRNAPKPIPRRRTLRRPIRPG